MQSPQHPARNNVSGKLLCKALRALLAKVTDVAKRGGILWHNRRHIEKVGFLFTMDFFKHLVMRLDAFEHIFRLAPCCNGRHHVAGREILFVSGLACQLYASREIRRISDQQQWVVFLLCQAGDGADVVIIGSGGFNVFAVTGISGIHLVVADVIPVS